MRKKNKIGDIIDVIVDEDFDSNDDFNSQRPLIALKLST